MRRRLWFAIPLIFLFTGAPAGLASEALDRGKLNLAWDAWESGLCEEVLSYLGDIQPGSPTAAEALRLRTDCLAELGRHAEAARLLEEDRSVPPPERRDLLLEVYSSWAWELTQQERYAEVESLAARGLAVLPKEGELEGMAAVASLRGGLARARSGGLRGGRLKSGEEYAVRAQRDRPEGRGWIRAYPWDGETPWTPELTLEDWMPSLAAQLQEKGRTLWLRMASGKLIRVAGDEARRRGLTVRRSPGGLVLGLGGEETFWDEGEWKFRAAAEGLGLRGAAVVSVVEAFQDLRSREELARWVGEHRGRLDVRRDGQLLRLRNVSSGRTYVFDPAVWASTLRPDSRELRDFWSNLVTELERPSAPYRCFCGRPAVLRETLLEASEADDGSALVLEKGKGYSVVLLALCPLHQQYVTTALLREWGVDAQSAWVRARAEAVETAWDLAFERGEAGGVSYLVLQGEGVSSLARRPELLLGALEAVEGASIRGASISVRTPTVSSLIVIGSDAPEDAGRSAERRVLMNEQRRWGAAERVGYRTSIRLPNRGAGTFQVRPRE